VSARHFLEIDDVSARELDRILALARSEGGRQLSGLGVAIVLALPSSRTRNSTEMAVVDLGGHPIALAGAELGIDSRETAEDVARTLAQYHRIIAVRIRDHSVLERMALALDRLGSDVPVVNLLSDAGHPVQALADLLTLADCMASGDPAGLRGQTVSWVGDANNVARSLALAAVGVGMQVRIASPKDYRFSTLDTERIDAYADAAGLGGSMTQCASPEEAVDGAAAICTDVWVSMGQESERAQRIDAFASYQVDERLLALAGAGAVLLHCLPAHRGEEVTEGAIEGSQSRIWQQAAHRRTAMRGLLAWLVEEAS
jgi:ornithine carbamoyltransferase